METQSCLKNPHGQGSLVGYSSWSHKESDTAEQLSTAQHRYLIMQEFIKKAEYIRILLRCQFGGVKRLNVI